MRVSHPAPESSWPDRLERAPQALRYASAALGTQLQAAELLGASTRGLRATRGAVSALRVAGDIRDVFRDARSDGSRAQLAETALRSVGHQAAAMRGVLALRRIEGRLASRVGVLGAVADAGVAAATVVNATSSAAERVAAVTTAVASAAALAPVPILGPLCGLAAIGLSLWRDAENDRGRAR